MYPGAQCKIYFLLWVMVKSVSPLVYVVVDGRPN